MYLSIVRIIYCVVLIIIIREIAVETIAEKTTEINIAIISFKIICFPFPPLVKGRIWFYLCLGYLGGGQVELALSAAMAALTKSLISEAVDGKYIVSFNSDKALIRHSLETLSNKLLGSASLSGIVPAVSPSKNCISAFG